jgi:hypothetical protein
MSRKLASAALVALVLALVAAFVVAVVHRPGQASVRVAGGPLSVKKTLSPRDPQFGDTVTATVDVSVDSRRVDARTVRVAGRFAPYRIFSRTQAVRRTGSVSLVHLEYRLRCLDVACAPQGERKIFRFADLRVVYRGIRGPATLSSIWPAFRVHTRVTAADLQRPFLRVGPPHESRVDYRLPPRPTGYTLLALAAVLALGGALLVVRAGLRGRRFLRAAALAPLDRILDELAAASSNGDSGRRRRALEELARELEPLHASLSAESRVLAWAPQAPGPDNIAELTSRVRTAVRR